MENQEKSICYEYAAGLCLKSHFNFNDMVEKCKLIHDDKARELFNTSNVLIGREKEVYKKYCKIISECNRKIRNNKTLLKSMKTINEDDKKIDELLEKVTQMISKFPTNYKLICIYSKLVEEKKYKNDMYDNFVVCKLCGLIYDCKESEVCGHYCHESYVKLRDQANKLFERIKKLKR